MHGEESGSVDRKHNLAGSRPLDPNPTRLVAERHLTDQPVYTLDQPRRDAVLASILDRARQRGWTILAAHVRVNHVHIVVSADAAPERVMNDLKSYASRILNQNGFDTADRKRWARHGSTRWLRERDDVENAIRYIIEKQGDPMAAYIAADRR
jgi:REP element-mobilizing transposase RayT